MLILPDGTRIGAVSGGCLEGDVAKKAGWRTQGGPVLRTYDVDEFGLGCSGAVDILLERLDRPASHRYRMS